MTLAASNSDASVDSREGGYPRCFRGSQQQGRLRARANRHHRRHRYRSDQRPAGRRRDRHRQLQSASHAASWRARSRSTIRAPKRDDTSELESVERWFRIGIRGVQLLMAVEAGRAEFPPGPGRCRRRHRDRRSLEDLRDGRRGAARAARREHRDPQGRIRRDHGAVRLGQIHVDEPDRLP